ncbi:MAG: glucuronate isomerase [Clostridiales bacterium]
MKPFMDENFLLNCNTSIELYNKFAKDMPIFDYHCHLDAKEIAEDKKYNNITEVWLYGDHYKWRLMRAKGVPEKFITGDGTDKEKFMKWAETIPYCIGNPIYHWTHMELKKYFDINEILSPKTAEHIWTVCNEKLKKDLTVKNIIKKSNVDAIFTTNEPTDNLEYHKKIKKDGDFINVLPTFRPDKFINIEKNDFRDWVKKLEAVSEIKILNFDDLINALRSRIKYFNSIGTKISDHALDPIVYRKGTKEEVDIIFKKSLENKPLENDEIEKYKTKVLILMAKEYYKYNWAMQIHIGVNRNNNSKMMKTLGPDTGYDSIGDYQFSESLIKFLDSLEKKNKLPKTIMYCLNPRDNEVIATIAGCFQGNEISGRIQYGPAWWFNDHIDGMKKQITTLANYGVLSEFLGMLTDSRSFLSYTRHEYFRRLLCEILGQWIEFGELPNDIDAIGNIIKDICYNNAKKYFSE